MKPPPSFPPFHRPPGAGVALFTAALLLLPAAAPAADEPAAESRYLTVFTDSVTRAETPIIELPFSVEVITESFIEDTGAISLRDALRYTAGLETTFTSLQSGDPAVDFGSYRLRGFVQDSAMRNGFRANGYADRFNITEVEVLRGPNGLLYGAGTTGGTVVYHTRLPTDVPLYSIDFAAGSHDLRRMTASASGPVNEHLRYAVSALFSESDDWYDQVDQERQGFAPAVEWTPFKNTTLLVEAEVLRLEGNNPSNDPFQFRLDPFQTDFTQPGAPVVRVPYVQTKVFPSDMVGFFDYPGDRRWEGANDRKDEDSHIRIGLNQKIGDDLEIDFGYAGSKRERDQRRATIDITSLDELLNNPGSDQFLDLIQEYPWLLNPASPEFQDTVDQFGNLLAYNWETEESEETRHQFRLETSYHLPVSEMWSNDFLVGASYIETEIKTGGSALVTLNPDFVAGQPISELFNAPVPRLRALADFSPIQFDPRPDEFNVGGLSDPTKFTERGAYFVHSGTYWDNRIRSVTGLRYDKFSVKRPPRRSQFTGEVLEGSSREDSPSTTNLSFGLSLSPHEDSPWSVYVLTASSVDPVFSRTDATGRTLPPTESQSQEAGLKFAFLDGKASGTLAVYNIDREGVVQSGGTIATAPPGSVFFDEDARRTFLRDDRSRGVDLQTVFTDLPVRNLQTVLNVSYTDYEITDQSGPSYIDDNTGFARVDVPFDKDRTNNGTPPFSVRIWSLYTFREGPLAGLDLGLGFIWTDEREATLSPFDEVSFIEIDPYEQWDAAIGYTTTIAGARCRIQFNVFNLTDEDGFYGYAYRNPQGRESRVTLSLQF